jgi:hypothetical protein
MIYTFDILFIFRHGYSLQKIRIKMHHQENLVS